MVRGGMGGAVGAVPASCGAIVGIRADLAAVTGSEAQGELAGAAGGGGEHDRAGFVVGAGDAAGGAGESDVGERDAARQCSGGLPQETYRLRGSARCWGTGLLRCL